MSDPIETLLDLDRSQREAEERKARAEESEAQRVSQLTPGEMVDYVARQETPEWDELSQVEQNLRRGVISQMMDAPTMSEEEIYQRLAQEAEGVPKPKEGFKLPSQMTEEELEAGGPITKRPMKKGGKGAMTRVRTPGQLERLPAPRVEREPEIGFGYPRGPIWDEALALYQSRGKMGYPGGFGQAYEELATQVLAKRRREKERARQEKITRHTEKRIRNIVGAPQPGAVLGTEPVETPEEDAWELWGGEVKPYGMSKSQWEAMGRLVSGAPAYWNHDTEYIPPAIDRPDSAAYPPKLQWLMENEEPPDFWSEPDEETIERIKRDTVYPARDRRAKLLAALDKKRDVPEDERVEREEYIRNVETPAADYLNVEHPDWKKLSWELYREMQIERFGPVLAEAGERDRLALRKVEGIDRAVRTALDSMALVEVPYYDGPAIRYHDLLKKVQLNLYVQQLNALGGDMRTITNDQKKAARLRANYIAVQEMGRIIQSRRGVIFIDPYGQDITEDLMKLPGVLRVPLAIMAPTGAVSVDPAGVLRGEEVGEYRGQPRISYRSLKYESPLAFYGRFAPTTYLAALMEDGADLRDPSTWADIGVINSIRSGVDIFQKIPELGELWVGTEGEADREILATQEAMRAQGEPEATVVAWGKQEKKNWRFGRRWLGRSTLLPLIFLEPDPTTVALMTGGPAVKAIGWVNRSRKLSRAAGAVEQSSIKLRQGEWTLEQGYRHIEKADPVTARAWLSSVGVRTDLEGTPLQQASDLIRQADDLEAEAAKLLPEISSASTQQIRTGLAAEHARLGAEVAELRWAGAQAQLMADEAKLVEFLKLHQIDDVAIGRIVHGRGKLPADEESLKVLQQTVKKAKAALKTAEKTAKAPLLAFRKTQMDQRKSLEHFQSVRRKSGGKNTDLYIPAGHWGPDVKVPGYKLVEGKPAPGRTLAVRGKDGVSKVRARNAQGRLMGGGDIWVQGVVEKVVLKAPKKGHRKALHVTMRGNDGKTYEFFSDLAVAGPAPRGLGPGKKTVGQIRVEQYVEKERTLWRHVAQSAEGPASQVRIQISKLMEAEAQLLHFQKGGTGATLAERFQRARGVVKDLNGKRKAAAAAAFQRGGRGKPVGKVLEDAEVLKKLGILIDKEAKLMLRAQVQKQMTETASAVGEDIAKSIRAFLSDAKDKFGTFGLRGKASLDEISEMGTKLDPKIIEGYLKVAQGGGMLGRWGLRTHRRGEEITGEVRPGILRDQLESHLLSRTPSRLEREIIERTGGRGTEYTDEMAAEANKVLEHFFTMPQAGPLKKLWEEAEGVNRSIAKTLTQDEVADLQTAIIALGRFTEGFRVRDQATVWGRAIFQAWKDLNVSRGASVAIAKSWRQFENVQGRVGKVSEEVEQIIKATENFFTLFRNELLEVSTLGVLQGGGKDIARAILYMDTDEIFRLKEGTSMFRSSLAGEGSIGALGRRQMLADTRADPRRAAWIKKNGDEHRGELLDILNTVDASDVDRLRAAAKIKSLENKHLAALRSGEAGVPLRAYSRMWIRTDAGEPTQEQASLLLGLALKNLKEAEPILDANGKVVRGIYEVASEKMRLSTRAVLGTVETSDRGVGRAHAMGMSAFGGAASLGHFNYLMRRLAGGSLTSDQAADINRLLGGYYKEVVDEKAALDGLTALGLPFTEKVFWSRVASGQNTLVEKSRRLVELGSSKKVVKGEVSGVFVPRNIIDEMEAGFGRIVKELHMVHPQDPATRSMVKGWESYLNLWRQSVITGLGVPNPRYWTNNVLGDFSQMWIEVGAPRALKLSSLNVLSNLPLGRVLQDVQYTMAESVAKKHGSVPVLPSIVESLFNPHMGRIFKGESGAIVSRNNRVLKFDDIRRWATEDGIMDTFVHEELLEVYSKLSGRVRPLAIQNALQRNITDHATLVQQRQRLSMYTDLLHKGATRTEARERTLRALYDWKHGIAQWETQIAMRHVPFWRFWRLAIKQFRDAALEPFVKPSGEMIKKALTGQSQIARIRQQAYLFSNWGEVQDAGQRRDLELSQFEEANQLAAGLYPAWAESRVKTSAMPIDPQTRQFFQDEYGIDYTHQMNTWPTITALDQFMMMRGLTTGLAAIAHTVTGGPFDEYLAEDWMAQFWEPMIGSTYPLFENMMRGALDTFGAPMEYRRRSSQRVLSPHEFETMRALPWARGFMQKDPETGRWTVSTLVHHALIRGMPFFGTQVPDWVRAYKNPAIERDLKEWTGMFVRRISRVGAPTYYSAPRIAAGRVRGIGRDLSGLAPERFTPEGELSEAAQEEGLKGLREQLRHRPPGQK